MPLQDTRQLTIPYGQNIDLARSKKIAAAAARKADRMKVDEEILLQG
jgi:hypothetical protein